MNSGDFIIESFNHDDVTRVTHRSTGIMRQAAMYQGDRAQIAHMMDEITQEIEDAKQDKESCSFTVALQAVVEEGKGMRLDVWDDDITIRAQHPDEHSKMSLPYLYYEDKHHKVPWSIDSSAPFATWRIVE